MTITLTREEAQQVLDVMEGSIDAQEWEINDHITKYGEWFRPQRIESMKRQLADANSTIDLLRARLEQPEQRTGDCLLTGVCAAEGHRIQKARPEPEPVAWHEPGAYGNVTLHKDWAKENGWLPLYKEGNT